MKKQKLSIENLVYEYEQLRNIRLIRITSMKWIDEDGKTFNVTLLNGVKEINKQFEKYNDEYFKYIDLNDKKYYNKYLNILDKEWYYVVKIVNDFGDEILEFKNINIKITKDKLRSFFNDCLHYMNKIISLYESDEKHLEILCGEIDGKHNDLYVIANVKDYNLLPDFKGGECTEHIIGRMNTLLHIMNQISNKKITNIKLFRKEVFAKSKFIKTPPKFNTEISKFQNNKLFKSEDYISLLKKYCVLSVEDEETLRDFIDNNKINIDKETVVKNIIKNKNYIKEFINKNYLKIYEN